MRDFCWDCHRPRIACFCEAVQPFQCGVDFALLVHPMEAKSTVGTAWIVRRSMPTTHWIRTAGIGLDADPRFVALIHQPNRIPMVLFPGDAALHLNRVSESEWHGRIPSGSKPLFIVIDGTWSQASSLLKRSKLLQALPRVSFDPDRLSEYEFKRQPAPACLSSVEGVHRVITLLESRGWAASTPKGAHDQMIAIFKNMVRFQLSQNKTTPSLTPSALEA